MDENGEPCATPPGAGPEGLFVTSPASGPAPVAATVVLAGRDAAARWGAALAAQGLEVRHVPDVAALARAPSDRKASDREGPDVVVIDDDGFDVGLDDAALGAALAGLDGGGPPAIVLFRLPRGVSFRARREELLALGAADVMEAPAGDPEAGAAGDLATRIRALLLRRRPPHVLVVEDDAQILAWVGDILAGAGMRVTGTASLAAARAAFEAGRVDALVVDRTLPDGDGLDFVAGLRRHAIGTPALLFTAMDDLEDRLRGLREARADDYVCKPVHAEELLARVQVMLRPREDRAALVWGPLEVDRRDRLVRWGGTLVPLRAKEAEMLIYLAERDGLRIPQRMLFVDVWHKLFMEPSSNPVAAAKHRLVANLRDFVRSRGGTCPDVILTEGDAYRFVPGPLLRLPPDAGANAGPGAGPVP